MVETRHFSVEFGQDGIEWVANEKNYSAVNFARLPFSCGYAINVPATTTRIMRLDHNDGAVSGAFSRVFVEERGIAIGRTCVNSGAGLDQVSQPSVAGVYECLCKRDEFFFVRVSWVSQSATGGVGGGLKRPMEE